MQYFTVEDIGPEAAIRKNLQDNIARASDDATATDTSVAPTAIMVGVILLIGVVVGAAMYLRQSRKHVYGMDSSVMSSSTSSSTFKGRVRQLEHTLSDSTVDTAYHTTNNQGHYDLASDIGKSSNKWQV